MNMSDVKIESCTFTNFIPNIINIKSKSDTGTFIFRSNTIENIRGSIIHATNMKVSPTISDNIFTKCNVEGPLIVYGHDADEISSGNTFSNGGSINMQFIRETNKKSSLKFTNCKFNQNTNTNGNGGAFNYDGDYSSSQVSISMTNCEFKTNKAPSGHGSALVFNIRYDIELSGCIFEGNEATQGGVICIRSMSNNNAKLLSEPSQTFSITNCQFTRKTLHQGSCLYFSNEAIDGETPSYDDIELEITSTNFNDNGGSQQFYFVSPREKLLFDNNSITYSDKSTSTPTLELTNLRERTIKDSQFIRAGSSEKAAIKIEQVDANGYIKLIQTIGNCNIINCIFKDNIANHQVQSAEMLFDNYYFLKNEGRGGAIYINPTYSYENYNDNANYLKEIKIEVCTFERNKAFDGYAIYIKGYEGAGTNFIIRDNTFTDNYDNNNLNSNKSVIASEVYLIYEGNVERNIFSYSDQNINVAPSHYVDHYGVLIAATPTPSDPFSPSSPFSQSSLFIKSSQINPTSPFTLSSSFTTSNGYSPTNSFSSSSPFSPSNSFSSSSPFSPSNSFSSSSPFSPSNGLNQQIHSAHQIYSVHQMV